MSDLSRLRMALRNIATQAVDALAGLDGSEGQYGGEYGGDAPAPGPADPVCMPLSVPQEFLSRAVQASMAADAANVPVEVQGAVEQALQSGEPIPSAIVVNIGKYWGPTARTITVSFMETTDAATRNKILSYMNQWSNTCGINFQWTQGVGTIRISRGFGGYSSYVGTDNLLIPRNRKTMNLQGFMSTTPDDEYSRVVAHETGHALGFEHEQMRPEIVRQVNRMAAYAYFGAPPNNWPPATVDFNVLTPLDVRTIMGTPVDQDSVMCYHLPARIMTTGIAVRGGARINASDAAFAGRIYPKPRPTPFGTSQAPAADMQAGGLDVETDQFRLSDAEFARMPTV